jgi:hypothetical protein
MIPLAVWDSELSSGLLWVRCSPSRQRVTRLIDDRFRGANNKRAVDVGGLPATIAISRELQFRVEGRALII